MAPLQLNTIHLMNPVPVCSDDVISSLYINCVVILKRQSQSGCHYRKKFELKNEYILWLILPFMYSPRDPAKQKVEIKLNWWGAERSTVVTT
jgi:hypothetical protein